MSEQPVPTGDAAVWMLCHSAAAQKAAEPYCDICGRPLDDLPGILCGTCRAFPVLVKAWEEGQARIAAAEGKAREPEKAT